MQCRTGLLFLTLVAFSAFGAEYDRAAALDISQGAIGRQLDNYTLRDSAGQPFVMSELRGKPLLVSMIYTSCHHICPTITRNMPVPPVRWCSRTATASCSSVPASTGC